MIHLEMPEPEARRLLRLLESQERADRFPYAVSHLRRAFGSWKLPWPDEPSPAVKNQGDGIEQRSPQPDRPRMSPP